MSRRLIVAWFAIALALVAPSAAARQSDNICDRFGEGSSTGRVKSTKLTEISGLVASRRHPGVYWTHNDSGGKPEVFALALDGTHLGSYAFQGATATDWEDIAIGPKAGATGSYLYAADIGNNAASLPGMGTPRQKVTVYRVAEPAGAPSAPGAALSGVERFDLVYPGGPEDAESLLVDPVSGDLIVVTKSVLGRSRILVARGTSLVNGASITMTDAGVIQIVPVINPTSTFPGTFVTGADISADGSLILVRTYQALLAFTRGSGESVPDALHAGSCNAPQINERQGEAVAIASDGSRYVTIGEDPTPAINVFPIAATAAAPTPETTTTTARSSGLGQVLARTGDEAALALLAAATTIAAVLLVRRAQRQTIGRDGEI